MVLEKIKELLNHLLNNGLVYRYRPERFEALKGGGMPYPSPTREVNTKAGPMIEEAIQPVMEPVVLDAAATAEAKKLAVLWPKFLQAQLEIFRLASAGQLPPATTKLIRSLCTAEEWQAGLTNPGYPAIQPFVRLDAILTPDGFKVIDINTTRPAGAGDIINFERIVGPLYNPKLISTGMAGAFVKIVKNCLDNWSAEQNLPGESVPLSVVIRETDGDWHNFAVLVRQLLAAGLNSSLVEPEKLNGNVLAIIRGRIKEGDPAYELLKQGYPTSRCIMSPLFRRFLGNKLWMYLYRLDAFKGAFKEKLGQGYQALDLAFPPIGVVQQGLVNFADQEKTELTGLNRKQWVVKDPAGSSGRRMTLGLTMGQAKWLEAIAETKDNAIVQMVYRSVKQLPVANKNGEVEPANLFTKYGIFIFGSQLAGIEFMARPSALVHGARDTYFNSVYLAN